MASALNLPAPAYGTDNTLASASAPSTSKFASTGGIIFPPPELRRTIDKAAELIAKKDPSFEANIKTAEANNPKFAFLRHDDAYHAYYASRRDAVRRGETLTPVARDNQVASSGQAQFGSPAAASDIAAGSSTQAPPESEPFQFSADLPNITAVDLDILKLTALFTARKGRSFATQLLSREAKSYQFEFLKPSHSLFTYFNHLVDQYQKVIAPTPALLDDVKLAAYGTTDPASIAQQRAKSTLGSGKGGARPHVLQRVKARAEWEKYSREKRKKQDEDQEKQRHAFNEIDWQDFVVVGTVELTEADQHIDLPPPRSLREMQTMSLAQKKMASMIMESEAAGEDAEEVEELAMPGQPSTSSTISRAATSSSATVQEVAAGKGGTIKVRKDYVPRGLASRNKPSSSTTAMTKCPVCGDQVPVDEMAEHVRFELLNPAYREQRQQLEAKKAQQAALQAGADPTYYLKQLASSRAEENEEARLKREAEERRLAKEKEKIVWDGRAKSKQAAREMIAKNAGLEEEMNRLSGKPVFKAPKFGPQFPGMDGDALDADEDADEADDKPIVLPKGSSLPAKPTTSVTKELSPQVSSFNAGVKRPASTELSPPSPPPAPLPSSITLAKNTDGSLHPEKAWLQAHSTPTVTLSLTISAPEQEGSVRKEPYEAALKSTIATLRDYVYQDLFNNNVAASKIKIKVNGKPATLKQSLAYWNLTDGDVVMIDVVK
ncbi:related to Splicing factor 3 subunit 1 [Melanopsichium pennsylvanicum]|uniref:Related to Splicing factor 3 subunit 1 n=2 Tax=Melanopsichium pennsylvanicum TaxID=63383 RepID=A0AAJ4XFV3_9BASI|nr:related to Splicing factor 3 subunit 1 [Melanopsichium pennsylvanicum 4]SNX81619.1 related to Splicing factor 3 subunit 1 [Melanopsichium pennsylvanicum]